MLELLLPKEIVNFIKSKISFNEICEIRVRLRRKLVVKSAYDTLTLDYLCSQNDIDHIIKVSTYSSLYSFEDEIKKGFIAYNGVRIGLCGEGVTNNNELITIKNINSLIIRVPREILGLANKLPIFQTKSENVLIISPPFGGKTTLLRDIARIASNKYDTLLIDERGELFNPKYTFGNNLDVFTGATKNLIYEGIIRACSPEIVILDEVFPKNDLIVLEEISRSGVKFVATIHGKDINSIKDAEFISLFDVIITLSNKPNPGSIKSIIRP